MHLHLLSVMLALLLVILPAGAAPLGPGDLAYLGAFRMPDDGTEYGFLYGGGGLAFRPDGDGGRGSLFVMGHDQQNHVAEISIPVPGRSASDDPGDLPAARIIQPFADIKAGIFVDSGDGVPKSGDIAYLSAEGGREARLYFTFAEHFEYEQTARHASVSPDLSEHDPNGPWLLGSFPNFATDDYLAVVPEGWSRANAPEYLLATGRYREGSLGGSGPALFLFAPWLDGDPPAPNSRLSHVVPLLLYEKGYEGSSNVMNGYLDADEWSGCAWVSADNRSAVVFAGTKARGDCWYGWANGKRYDPEEPDPGPAYGDRGWWADSFEAVLLFYDPDDLAAVASGRLSSYGPQPVGELMIEPYLFRPRGVQDKRRLGAATYDPSSRTLYVTEFRGDGDSFLVHAFRVGSSGLKAVPGGYGMPRDLDGDGWHEDVNGNGRKDFADVTLYFNQMTWIAANEPLAGFDYNGNGRIDFADLVVLFGAL
jgi:PKD repeat protein